MHKEVDLDEEMNSSMSSTGLMREQQLDNRQSNEQEVPLCGCLTVRFYQPFFDVDTSDVTSRLMSALFYCKSGSGENFISLTADKPDAYGPFWIATSLIFTVAVSSHISRWLTSWLAGQNWEYNFESVVTSASIIYGFAVGAPFVFYLILGQYGAKFKLINAICLYGYSLFIYLPATFLCFIPSGLASWLAMLGAGGASTLFLLRNLAPLIAAHARQQEMPILGLIW